MQCGSILLGPARKLWDVLTAVVLAVRQTILHRGNDSNNAQLNVNVRGFFTARPPLRNLSAKRSGCVTASLQEVMCEVAKGQQAVRLDSGVWIVFVDIL